MTNLIGTDVPEEEVANSIIHPDLAMAEGILLDASIISGLDPSLLRSRTRVRRVCVVRQAMCFIMRKRTKWSYPQIGRYLNLTDHTTVIHACKMVEKDLATDGNLSDLINKLMEAEPIMPLQIDEVLKASGITLEKVARQPRAKPVKMVDSRGKTKTKYVFEVKPRPPVKKPEWSFDEIDGKPFKINSKGQTQDEVDWRKMLVKGSADLLAALNTFMVERRAAMAGVAS